MKIVIATPFYPPQTGVLATYAEGLEGAFRALGHDILVVPLPSRSILGRLVFFVRVLRALADAAFVLSLDTWSVGQPTLLAARIRRVPFVIRIGGDHLWEAYVERTGNQVRLSDFYSTAQDLSRKERVIKRALARMLTHARHVFFNTEFQRALWGKAYGLDSTHSSVLENFYPPKTETPRPERKRFLCANRPARYKNAAELASAFARVKKRHPDIELDASYVLREAQLERLAHAYAVIIPSVSEVGSNIAIEAVSHGRPFIISEDTGTKERLLECGLFIDTRSEEAMEKAIEDMLDPTVYERLSRAARTFSFTHSWDDIAREILAAVRL